MNVNVRNKMEQSITSDQFLQSMQKNKEAFEEWGNKFQWHSQEDKDFFASLANRDDLVILILLADWCGDVVRNVPVVLRALAETHIPVHLLVMEDHLDLMDQFLTLGGRSIPVVIVADTGGTVLGKWGPRPTYVQEPMVAFKEKNPDREASDYQDNLMAARAEIMRRYGEGTEYQKLIVQELRVLLESV